MDAARVPLPVMEPLPRTSPAMPFVTAALLSVAPLKIPRVPLPRALFAVRAKVPALITVPPV